MKKTSADYLKDMLDYIGDIENFTEGGQVQFLADRKTYLAVIRSYEVLGEITKRLPDDLLAQQAHIRWKDIKGFRDILIHQYDKIEAAVIEQALLDLPNLRQAVENGHWIAKGRKWAVRCYQS